jgi:hypothetical protein
LKSLRVNDSTALTKPLQSTEIPANLTTFSHFSVSALIISPKA